MKRLKLYGQALIKKESGFTLIEMMIVLVIISILLLIAVPNMAKNQATANNKGCEATVELIKTQKLAYEIDTGKPLTDLNKLLDEQYVDTLVCPNGDEVTISHLNFSEKTSTP